MRHKRQRLDSWPNAEISIQLAPWAWHWRPSVYFQEGATGMCVLFLEVRVNWLSRRYWRPKATGTVQG